MQLMLDSGAHSVINSGKNVELKGYIEFCNNNPEPSYFVNLDVIPAATDSLAQVEKKCQQSYDNCRAMLDAGIPLEKLIPVFHKFEPIKWFNKYLDLGFTYIGISGQGKDVSQSRIQKWYREISPYLLNRDGAPKVKIHGFGVGSFRLMRNALPWYSVDATTCIVSVSGNWKIWVPRNQQKVSDYQYKPFTVSVSDRANFSRLDPIEREMFYRYINRHGFKLSDLQGEHGSKNRIILNTHFLRVANYVLGIRDIYFAGGAPSYEIEDSLSNRLLSYATIRGNPSAGKRFDYWCERIKKYGQRTNKSGRRCVNPREVARIGRQHRKMLADSHPMLDFD